MSGGFAEHPFVLVILRWYNLIPRSDRLVGSLFCQLLCHSGFGNLVCA